jgi:hypothetical protein
MQLPAPSARYLPAAIARVLARSRSGTSVGAGGRGGGRCYQAAAWALIGTRRTGETP